jgi:hypothetical protein
LQAGEVDRRALCSLLSSCNQCMLAVICKSSPAGESSLMRFLNKYDLQEPTTAGPLKIYEASETETGRRLLIEILEWQEVPAEASTLHILERFSQAAPDPPGIILDAGRIEQTNQIYLVTTFPADLSSLQRWVKSCLGRWGVAATDPKSTFPAQAAARPSAPATFPARNSAEIGQSWTRHEPGAFTKEFLGALDGSYGIASAPPPAPPTVETSHEPGAFTKEFLSLSPGAAKEDNERAPAASRTAPSQLVDDAASGSATSVSIPRIPELTVDQKTGEFTSFFRGYSDAPPEPSSAVAPPAPDFQGSPARRAEGGLDSPGELTKMFKGEATDVEQGPVTGNFDMGAVGSPQPSSFTPDPVPLRRAPLRDPITFREPAPPSLNSPAPEASSFEPAWKGQTTGTPASVTQGTPLTRPLVESAPTPGGSLEPAWKEDKMSGATQFITPPATQQPPPEPVSTGPSEFTRVISAASVPGGGSPPPSPTPAVPPVQAPVIQAPVIQAPVIQAPVIQAPGVQLPPVQLPPTQVPPVQVRPPSMAAPAVAGPVWPQAPAVPHLPAMQAPPVPAPAPPSAPAPAPKLVSYLPLIITLNVLLIAAIAIVLYFALKSHH